MQPNGEIVLRVKLFARSRRAGGPEDRSPELRFTMSNSPEHGLYGAGFLEINSNTQYVVEDFSDQGVASSQTARAVSTTRRSLASCSSVVMTVLPMLPENPHCGLRQSRSNGTYCEASSMRRRSMSCAS